jgi:hypothetical protein
VRLVKDSKHIDTGWRVDIWIGQDSLRGHDNHVISMTQMHYDATDGPLSFLLSSDLPTLRLNNALLMFYVELDANTSSFHSIHVATLRLHEVVIM